MLWWLWQDSGPVCSWIFPSGYKYLNLTSFLQAWRPVPKEQELRACISKWMTSAAIPVDPLFLLCHLHRVFSAIVIILLLRDHWEVAVCFSLQDLACGLAACLTLESCTLPNGAGLCWFVRALLFCSCFSSFQRVCYIPNSGFDKTSPYFHHAFPSFVSLRTKWAIIHATNIYLYHRTISYLFYLHVTHYYWVWISFNTFSE